MKTSTGANPYTPVLESLAASPRDPNATLPPPTQHPILVRFR